MDKRTYSNWRMLTAVRDFLQEKVRKTSTMEELNARIDKLDAMLSEINTLEQERQTVAEGSRLQREHLYEELLPEGQALVKAIALQALAQGKLDLEAKCEEMLRKMERARLRLRVEAFFWAASMAATMLEQLEPIGWNAERLDAFKVKAESYRELHNLPRRTIALRASIRKRLYAMMDEAMNLLEREIDRLLPQALEPSLLSTYSQFRLRVDIGSRSTGDDLPPMDMNPDEA